MDVLAAYGSDSDTEPVNGIEQNSVAALKAGETPNRGSTDPPAKRRRAGDAAGFPHVEGNYATVVYIKLPQHERVRALFQQLLAELPSGAGLPRFYPVGAATSTAGGAAAAGAGAAKDGPEPLPPHVSLSRTVPIRIEQSRPLLASLSRALRAAAQRGAALRMRGVRAFANDERTRTFAALCVESGGEEFCRLVRAVNAAFAEHGLQTFYEDPQPHASFAWALGDHSAALTAALAAAPPPRHAPLEVPLAQVVCRVGQRENVVWTALL